MLRLALLASILVAAAGRADDEKGAKVELTRHTGHFEKNNSGLKGEPSLLLIADQKRFDTIFGTAFTMGAKPNTVPNGTFEKKLVAAVIRRGNAVWTYEVVKADADGGTLTVHYKAAEGKPGTATFASPLILSFDKGAIKKVVFVENGKEVGSAETTK